jgi:hypothetical protein
MSIFSCPDKVDFEMQAGAAGYLDEDMISFYDSQGLSKHYTTVLWIWSRKRERVKDHLMHDYR